MLVPLGSTGFLSPGWAEGRIYNRFQDQKRSLEPRVNFRIRVPKVRLIDQNGTQVGLIETKDALRMAQEAGLDLVEVSPNDRPPVCRIMDYGKFKYQQKKKHQKHHVWHLKAIRLSTKIQEHDLLTKAHHAQEFLTRGHKVLVTMMFWGRETTHVEIGREVMRKFVVGLGEYAKVERDMAFENRRLNMILAPGKAALRREKTQTPAPRRPPATGEPAESSPQPAPESKTA